MKVLKRVFDFLTGKKTILKENLNGSGTYLLDRVGSLINREPKVFFHQSIICCMADAFEYFLEADMNENINVLIIEPDTSEKFIQWEAMYHTLKFSKEVKNAEYAEELEHALFYIFDFTGDDKLMYVSFKEMLEKDEDAFSKAFSNAAASDIFRVNEINDIDTSFIYNFYYNCYTEFYRLFNKYSPAFAVCES